MLNFIGLPIGMYEGVLTSSNFLQLHQAATFGQQGKRPRLPSSKARLGMVERVYNRGYDVTPSVMLCHQGDA